MSYKVLTATDYRRMATAARENAADWEKTAAGYDAQATQMEKPRVRSMTTTATELRTKAKNSRDAVREDKNANEYEAKAIAAENPCCELGKLYTYLGCPSVDFEQDGMTPQATLRVVKTYGHGVVSLWAGASSGEEKIVALTRETAGKVAAVLKRYADTGEIASN